MDEPLSCLLQIESDSSAERASLYAAISHEYLKNGETDKALEYGFLSLGLAKKIDRKEYYKEAHLAIGRAYRRIRDFDKALTHFQKAKKHVQGDTNTQLDIYNSMGILYNQLGQFEPAKASLDSGYALASLVGDSFGMARFLTNLGFLHNRASLFPEAIDYYERSIKIKKKINRPLSLAYSLNDLGEVHSHQGRFKRAVSLSKKAIDLATQGKQPYYLRDMNRTLAKTYEMMGKYDSAYHYQLVYQSISDSISNQDRARQIATLEKQQELKEKDLLNAALSAENELQQAEIDQRNLLLVFSLSVGLILSILGFMLYRSNEKRKALLRKISSQNATLASSNEQLRKSLNEQESLFHIVSNDIRGPLNNAIELLKQEHVLSDVNLKGEMRQRVLTSANHALGFIDDFEAIQKYEKTTELPSKSNFDVVKMVSSIIEDFKSEIDRKKIDIHFSSTKVLELTTVQEYVRHILYNVFENAVKFSPVGANIFISIIDADSPRISIEDRGPGIDTDLHERIFERFYRGDANSDQSSGLGLPIAKLLLDRIGGQIKLRSQPGQGSEFIIYLSGENDRD
ncbi:MAG: ATP-binding protein [Salibacteraceae bacterium]